MSELHRHSYSNLRNALAITIALAGLIWVPAAVSLQKTPTDSPSAASVSSNEESSVVKSTVTAETKKTGMTLEQVRAAIFEAEKRRLEAARPDSSVPASVLKEWGVQVMRVAYTADGYFLDFRFRVVDAEKALPLFDSRIKPYLKAQDTELRFGVPSAAKVGALRTTNRGGNIKSGKNYYIMFSNPGYHVKPGQKVSVVIGDFKVENLVVN